MVTIEAASDSFSSEMARWVPTNGGESPGVVFLHRGVGAGDAGIVDQHIQPADFLDDISEQGA
ncbi:hypothetical protein [Arthrobacter sp. B10-11]|uniref:hypothetical protein n=1 Tax=Arthrobacter sp. B10-11 TaxID=3081160 RepID=UPI002953CA69|nr:hypothetical protein [Arthrobacter sp. B10-11]MDV8148015.1 hypothetical protein [Arthrobacter sp. B10-11]